MTDRERQTAARRFVSDWAGRGDEKSDTQSFWLSLLGSVFGIEEPHKFIEFEKPVKVDGSTKYIDAYIGATKVLIEQKSADIRLDKAYTQSGGAELTPYGQAKRYDDNLPRDDRARYIVISNFSSFLVFDMNRPGQPPEEILLSDLPKEFHRLKFLADDTHARVQKEIEISIAAGGIVRELYDRLLPKYLHPESPETLKSLNRLCVRLVFCLYAEDASLFGSRTQFHDYLHRFEARDIRRALIDLFRVLDTPPDRRDPYLDAELAAFPYVNGGLFADESVEIPLFDDDLKTILLSRASGGFDWSAISPTIFGAVFESTLNPETRRAAGMHYTSVQNIHKVIDPLFLDALKAELAAIKSDSVTSSRTRRLDAFRRKLASLTFFDPACGSGNFLTETYLSLRRLENEAIEAAAGGQMLLDVGNDLIRVSISQFHGIEINDFAVAVAKTALWIAESQMFMETETIVHSSMEFLPLKSYAGIVEGDALTMDWESVVPRDRLSYIMGNPPFVGARFMSAEQKREVVEVFGAKWQNVGNLDFVCCWYKKACEYMRGTAVRAALVSTNSITQGGQVADLWSGLDAEIDFAHRTFKWQNETKGYAAVHCVIIGFHSRDSRDSRDCRDSRTIYDGGSAIPAAHINAYLMDAPDIFIESRPKPLCDVPEIGMGNQPIDDGNYLFLPEEKEAFIKLEPASAKYFRPWYGSQEFINNCPRWCLWLGDCSPAELRSMPKCLERVANVRAFRLASNRVSTKKLADKPTRFQTENMPKGHYIVIPEVSSERRFYIPMGFMTPDVLCSNKLRLMPDATLYLFGVLTSIVHNAWTRVVCGRLKSDYSYSINIVYNNFPWPSPTDEQRAAIEKSAQAILDARSKYPDSSLADLYDDLTMPPDLRQAHHLNDHAVKAAYGYAIAMSEADIVADLFRRYRAITGAD